MFPHGVATRTDLLASGLSNSTISRNYFRILPEIYGTEEPTPIARCYAVTLWQPTAVLSHRTAAWLFGWMEAPTTIEFTLPAASRIRTPTWITVYRRTLHDRESTEIQALPVLIRERTLIDCIAVMKPDDVARIVDERLMGEIDADELRAVILASPKLRGNPAARRQLRKAATAFASEPERVLNRALVAVGLRLQANAWVGQYMCDFVDERAKVIVEVDGREYHSAPEVFSKDRRRQNDLVLDGWLVLRFSAFDVVSDPDRIARLIAEVVRRRRHARA
jgi:very-short-patch-repair endonuclease